MISLVYFLFAAMVGGFMVTSTHGSTYRLTRIRQESQAFYDAKSAANAITDMFSNMTYTFELWEKKLSDGNLVYFLESVYPYKINQKGALQGITNINGGTSSIRNRTYPVGMFKVDGKFTNNHLSHTTGDGKTSLLFEWLFSNHTVNNTSDNRGNKFVDKLYGNDLANMFVTTQGVWNAFPQVFPSDENGNKDAIDNNTLLSRLVPLYENNGDEDPVKVDFYRDGANVADAFNKYVKEDAKNYNKKLEDIKKENTKARNSEQLNTILENIAKSTPGEYSFSFKPHEISATTEGFENFSEYNVRIKFISNKDTNLVGAQQPTANDLFICVIELRKGTDFTTAPLYTVSSKCTITAERSDKNSTSSNDAVQTKVTMAWKDWQNVHATTAN